jgi:hypothetical protein
MNLYVKLLGLLFQMKLGFFHEYLRILSQVERCIANEITLLLCSHPTSSVDRGKYPRYGQNQRT